MTNPPAANNYTTIQFIIVLKVKIYKVVEKRKEIPYEQDI